MPGEYPPVSIGPIFCNPELDSSKNIHYVFMHNVFEQITDVQCEEKPYHVAFDGVCMV